MKMASSSNKSGGEIGSGCSRNIEGLVNGSCKQVVKKIIKEINENMAVLYAQLSRLDKYMELLKKTMGSL